MALPASGTISISQVSVELSRASTFSTSLGETAVRNLAGVASGAISLSNLWGKSAFRGIWSGTSFTTPVGLDTSGSSYRCWDNATGYGAWLTVVGTSLATGTSAGPTYHYLVSTSGTLQAKFGTATSSGLVYFNVTNKFTGSSTDGALYWAILETSGGLIRYRHSQGTTGAWVSLS